MIDVIPGILEQDFAEIQRKIRLVESYVPWVQIDILDGTLFDNNDFHEAKPFADLDTHLLLEAHLMVKNPANYVDHFFAAGFQRFIGHLEGLRGTEEHDENVYDFINACHQFGAEIGLAVDLPTPIEEVYPYLESLDQVLVMSIPSGRSGQSFHEEALEKIKALREKDPHMHIQVDGGINLETAKRAVAAGATRLAVTSAIFKSENIKEAIEQLKNAENG
jgi:ribulose-phosphate 3-epimerase